MHEILHSPRLPLHSSTQSTHENLFLLHSKTQLLSSSFLLIRTFPSIMSHFLTTKTNGFRLVSRLPCDFLYSLDSWLLVRTFMVVVPWVLAPETCDMTQVLLCRNWVSLGRYSFSLRGLLRSDQSFYFQWIKLHLFYWEVSRILFSFLGAILWKMSLFSTWIAGIGIKSG